jgi:voltage-gated sodium channel
MVARCAQIANSSRFQGFIFVVIVVNAIALGLQTYDAIDEDAGTLLRIVNEACVGIFVIELAIRITAYGSRPQDFFRDGWNVFDFVVITAAFVPGVRESTTLLRLARLLRVVRVVTVLPEFRIIVSGMARSLPPLGSLALLAVLMMYVYGMLGWILFHEGDPENWGNLGDAMLTLFVMMTLENWPQVMDAAQEIHSWSWVFFVSYIILASFLLFNVLIAVVLTSMEAAREEDARLARALRRELHEAEEMIRDERQELVDAMRSLRDAVDELEERIERTGNGGDPGRGERAPEPRAG